MSDEAAAPSAEPVAVPFTPPAQVDDTATSVAEAARQLSNFRWKRDNPEEDKSAASAPESAAEEQPVESAPEAATAPAEQTSGEQQADEPAQEPPIDPPKFWTSEAKERFQSLPRETQQYIVEREQARDAEIRRTQNEAAEQRKSWETKTSEAEQVRQKYESALPALLQQLHQEMMGEFSDLKTVEDVNRLAADDPFRFARYQAKQMQVATIQRETQQAQERQAQEFRQQWNDFAAKQDQAFAEKVPEMADPAKAKVMSESAASVLRDTGFTDQELAKLWNGEASISLRDHRVLLLIRDAVKLRDAQKAAAKPIAKTVPPVQRPGTATLKPAAQEAEVQALTGQLENTGSLKDAAALLTARRRAAAR